MTVEETLQELERPHTRWDTVQEICYFPVYRFIHRLLDIPGQVHAFYQRGRRGYADSDCWGLDSYLSSWLPEALDHMIDEEKGGGNSYPGYPGANSIEAWQEIIRQIAQGFRADRVLSEEMLDTRKGIGKELWQERQKGLKLFIKWYSHLWD